MVGMRVISSPHYPSTTILTFIVSFVSVLSSLALEAPSTRLLLRSMQADFSWLCKKQDGRLRPILCGEIWRRCFASLAVNATPVRNEAAKIFTSTYGNFFQTAGIRDGASHCAKILLVFYDDLDTSDIND